MTDRDHELQEIRDTYGRYRDEGRQRLWDPANRGYRRMVEDRDRDLLALLGESLPDDGGRVLDVGCGDGRMAEAARVAGMLAASWTGIDLDGSQVAAARTAHPWASFLEASADELPFEDGSFDVAIAATLFSSLPSPQLERAAAQEVARVIRPGGWLIWYDIRIDNPRNPAVHGLSADAVGRLFPGWTVELRSTTLLPPVARRLGPATSALYPLLAAIPVMRSHLVGRLRRER